MTVTPIKNGGQAIIQDLEDCYYYIHQYMGSDFLGELKNCIEPINVQDDLDATKYELESYEANLESAQRALIDIKEIVQRISGIGRVRQSQTALDALQEIVEIIDQEV
jgi:hypothetical protein|nr:MAG TPA: hypothetical protein [Caudoviricetes sp.]